MNNRRLRQPPSIPGARWIPLTKGAFCLVDNDDYERFSVFNWHYSDGYAMRSAPRPKRGSIIMHREILQVSKMVDVDHINGNRLDNRKKNLRVATRAENIRNSKLSKRNTSGYKGVRRQNSKWTARIVFNREEVHLGVFGTATEAAQAYNVAAIKYFGEFAYLNKVPQ